MSMNRRRLLLRHEYDKYIHFEDKEVEHICLEKWDKDKDGKLSKEEAATVSSIGTIHIQDGRKFNELQYFSGWKPQQWVTNDSVYFDGVVGEVTIPQNITNIGIAYGWRIMYNARPDSNQNLIVIFLGEMKEIGYWAISGDSNLRGGAFSILLPNTPTPPAFNSWVGENYNLCRVLYVPDRSVELYKAANITDVGKILPISEYKGNY